MGIKQIIVAINKMDACDYSEQRYTEIEDEMKKFIKKQGFKPEDTQFVGYSGYTGHNLVEDTKMEIPVKQIKCLGIKEKLY